jgi:hypothetical protein
MTPALTATVSSQGQESFEKLHVPGTRGAMALSSTPTRSASHSLDHRCGKSWGVKQASRRLPHYAVSRAPQAGVRGGHLDTVTMRAVSLV